MNSKLNIFLIILIHFNCAMCIVDRINVLEKFNPDKVDQHEQTAQENKNIILETSTENRLFGDVLGGANIDNDRSVISNIEKVKKLAEILESLGDKLIPLIMDTPPAVVPVLNRANDFDIISGSLRKDNGGNNIRSVHLFRTV